MTASEFEQLIKKKGVRGIRGNTKGLIKPKGGKSNKFNARTVEIDGIKFASQAEGYFYQCCKNLEIRTEVQPRYTILGSLVYYPGKRERKRFYTADFFLPDYNLIIDIKGGKATRTEAFSLRIAMLKRMLISIHPAPEDRPRIIALSKKQFEAFFNSLYVNDYQSINQYQL